MHLIATQLNTPLRIGSLEIKNRVLLAPLAGVSDVPFRRICQEMGAGLTFVEMLNANAVKHGMRKTMKVLQRHESESILGVQITGPKASQVAEATSLLDREGFDLIDINMGCPVRKIVSRGSGSGILRDPERMEETIAQARESTLKPLSVKVRLGYTREEVNIDESAQRVARLGADMFTVHGRTRSERYDVPADLKGIRQGLSQARSTRKKIVTVGNGDILSRESAYDMVRETGCDAIMVSRGALGNPWIFNLILDPTRMQPTLDEWLEVVLRHLEYHEEFYGTDKYSVVLTRKHLLWYANGFRDARRFRERLSIVDSLDAARNLLRENVREHGGTTHRFEKQGQRDMLRKASRYDPKFEMDRQADRAVAEEGL